VVELLAERQGGRRALVEASGNDRATRPGDPDGLVQRWIRAGELDHSIRAAVFCVLAYGQRKITM
jgi:hypothetical protein